MNLSEYIYVTSRPYSSLLQEIIISGKLFSSKQLAFNMQMQTQSNWCWAATSTSVSHFYWFWSTWTQCRVANGELGHSDCCNSSVPSACNVPWYLDKALTRTHNFVSIIGQQASFQQVREEIDAGRPVGARIGWNGSCATCGQFPTSSSSALAPRCPPCSLSGSRASCAECCGVIIRSG